MRLYFLVSHTPSAKTYFWCLKINYLFLVMKYCGILIMNTEFQNADGWIYVYSIYSPQFCVSSEQQKVLIENMFVYTHVTYVSTRQKYDDRKLTKAPRNASSLRNGTFIVHFLSAVLLFFSPSLFDFILSRKRGNKIASIFVSVFLS